MTYWPKKSDPEPAGKSLASPLSIYLLLSRSKMAPEINPSPAKTERKCEIGRAMSYKTRGPTTEPKPA